MSDSRNSKSRLVTYSSTSTTTSSDNVNIFWGPLLGKENYLPAQPKQDQDTQPRVRRRSKSERNSSTTLGATPTLSGIPTRHHLDSFLPSVLGALHHSPGSSQSRDWKKYLLKGQGSSSDSSTHSPRKRPKKVSVSLFVSFL